MKFDIVEKFSYCKKLAFLHEFLLLCIKINRFAQYLLRKVHLSSLVASIVTRISKYS